MRCSLLLKRAVQINQRNNLIKSVSTAKYAPLSSSVNVSKTFQSRAISSWSIRTSQRQLRTIRTMASAQGEAFCFKQAGRSQQSLVDAGASNSVVMLEPVAKDMYEGWLADQSDSIKAWVNTSQFKGKEGDVCIIPAPQGGIDRVVFGVEDPNSLWTYAGVPSKLPPGTYSLTGTGHDDAVALGWMLGTYSFDRYKTKKENKDPTVLLQWPANCNRSTVIALAESIFLARDMVTTPAEDMAPQDIAQEAIEVAAAHGGSSNVIVGDDLLTQGYPAIHTVGRASVDAPRLIDLRWAPSNADASSLPKVTLIGKGVSFDSGGLDIKPANAMKLMKKDMGGSALILGLAHAVMKTGMPVNLRVLIPAVENSISSNAFRPLDVLQTRGGITVENGNTDAEGRLILCDALAEAVTEHPDIIIDAATLTGAARVALGTELPALFSNDDKAANELIDAGLTVGDHLWRMPLHAPYRKMLDSKVADIYSCSEGGYAGAITAALFLYEFVKEAGSSWIHIDTMGYNLSSKPGRPEGGEAFALRACFEFLRRRYVK